MTKIDGGQYNPQITGSEIDLLKQLEAAKAEVQKAGGAASQDTLEKINRLEAKVLKYVETAKERLANTIAGRPQLPEAELDSIRDDLVKLTHEKFSEAGNIGIAIGAAIREFDELLGLIDQAIKDLPPDRQVTIANLWLKGTSITSINIAIQELTKLLSEITEKEQENARKQREAEKDSVKTETDAIKEEARLKAEMQTEIADIKLYTGIAQGASGIMGGGFTMASGGRGAGALRARGAGEMLHGSSQAIGSFGESATSNIQAEYEPQIAAQEALRTTMRDRGQSLHNSVESARRIVSESRDLLTKLLDQLQQLNSKAYQINLSRNG